MGKRKQTVSERIRAAAVVCPLGYNGLARKAGLEPSQVWRFAVGERGLTLANLDKLADALGLEVKQRGRGKS